MNEFAGRWLSGYWVFSNKSGYMRVHRKHHELAGTDADPDLGNYIHYPVSQRSFHAQNLAGFVWSNWLEKDEIDRAIAQAIPKP